MSNVFVTNALVSVYAVIFPHDITVPCFTCDQSFSVLTMNSTNQMGEGYFLVVVISNVTKEILAFLKYLTHEKTKLTTGL